MALQTILLAAAENNQINISLRYEDTTNRTDSVIYSNSTDQPARFKVTRIADGANKSFAVAPGSVNVIETLPSLQISIDPKGRIVGLIFQITWPSQ